MTGFTFGFALAAVALLAAAAVAYLKVKAAILQIQRRLDRIADEAAAGRSAAEARHAAVLKQMEAAAAAQDVPALLQKATAQLQSTAAIRRDLARLHVAARTTNVLANRHVIEHLDALGAAQVPPSTLSYGFQAAMRSLSPRITRRGDGRTVLCTLALGDAFRDRVRPALDSHAAYAEARGLSHAILSDPPSHIDRPPSWMKIPLIQDLFQRGFERVVYVDADALVTNPGFDVEGVFAAPCANGRLVVTEDEAGINCGVMFLEDGPAIRRLLDLVWLFDADVTQGTWEQFALKSLMSLSGDVARHVSIEADPRRFNSFPPERNDFHRTMDRSVWQPGDFLCHFSGIRPPHLEQLIARYAADVAARR